MAYRQRTLDELRTAPSAMFSVCEKRPGLCGSLRGSIAPCKIFATQPEDCDARRHPLSQSS